MAKPKIYNTYQQKHSALEPHAACTIIVQWLVEINDNWLSTIADCQIPGWHTDWWLKVVFYA